MRYRAGVRSRLISLRFTLRAAFGRLPSQRPLACVQVSGFRSPLFLPTPENSAGSPSERLKTCEIPNIKKIFQIMKKSVLFQDGF
jgi:hypothetical protein